MSYSPRYVRIFADDIVASTSLLLLDFDVGHLCRRMIALTPWDFVAEYFRLLVIMPTSWDFVIRRGIAYASTPWVSLS